MKAVKVQYTVKSDYTKRNSENIAKVMKDLRQVNNAGIKYSTFLMDDNKSFVHFAMMKDEDANQVLNNLDSFKTFQAELKASSPEVPPKVENLSLVACSYDIF
ncbi:MAG: hypothetical protein ABI462_07030 [Ignavibacteria bacterium]